MLQCMHWGISSLFDSTYTDFKDEIVLCPPRFLPCLCGTPLGYARVLCNSLKANGRPCRLSSSLAPLAIRVPELFLLYRYRFRQ